MNKANRPAILIETVILLAAALLLLLYFYADNRLLAMKDQEGSAARVERHYAFVSADDSQLWQNVFGEAAAQAARTRACLEWIGADSPVGFGIGDCMRIATASGVDGIILHKAPGDDMTALIGEAAAKDIPVIMALEDEAGSARVSYVGVNNYQMGESYARQVLSCLHEGENSILVISAGSMGEGASALMHARMLQVVEQDRNPAWRVRFETLELESGNSFGIEEAVRDLFIERARIPDIIVCLDPVSTECVSQAVVDYNEVGNTAVIGFCASDSVREAVDRGIIYSAVELDEAELGRVSVDALNEYWGLGRVSSYFNVSLSVTGGEPVSAQEAEQEAS